MHYRPIALALCLALAPVAYGCAAALPIITQVASVIAEITGVVDLIDSQAQASGALPPEVAKAITAVRAAITRINDAAQQGPAAYGAAVAEFERLYAELTAIVAPFGVVQRSQDARLAASPPGVVAVPPAGELGARLREAGQR